VEQPRFRVTIRRTIAYEISDSSQGVLVNRKATLTSMGIGQEDGLFYFSPISQAAGLSYKDTSFSLDSSAVRNEFETAHSRLREDIIHDRGDNALVQIENEISSTETRLQEQNAAVNQEHRDNGDWATATTLEYIAGFFHDFDETVVEDRNSTVRDLQALYRDRIVLTSDSLTDILSNRGELHERQSVGLTTSVYEGDVMKRAVDDVLAESLSARFALIGEKIGTLAEIHELLDVGLERSVGSYIISKGDGWSELRRDYLYYGGVADDRKESILNELHELAGFATDNPRVLQNINSAIVRVNRFEDRDNIDIPHSIIWDNLPTNLQSRDRQEMEGLLIYGTTLGSLGLLGGVRLGATSAARLPGLIKNGMDLFRISSIGSATSYLGRAITFGKVSSPTALRIIGSGVIGGVFVA